MPTETKQRTPPAPVINPESRPYWDAAQHKKLMFKHCRACDNNHFYPRALCPFCFSDQTEWKEASGEGTLYTHSTMRRGVPIPYTLAYVTLAEGPKMLTNIYDCDNTKLRIDQPMKLVFKTAENGKLIPGWTLA